MSKLTKLKPRISKADTTRTAELSVDRLRGRHVTKARKRIAIRDKYTCQECGEIVAVFEIDHKIPLFMGGLDTDSNRQLLCLPCHEKKSKLEEKYRGS